MVETMDPDAVENMDSWQRPWTWTCSFGCVPLREAWAPLLLGRHARYTEHHQLMADKETLGERFKEIRS